jgi:methyl-accepting chemotaxis protein
MATDLNSEDIAALIGVLKSIVAGMEALVEGVDAIAANTDRIADALESLDYRIEQVIGTGEDLAGRPYHYIRTLNVGN